MTVTITTKMDALIRAPNVFVDVESVSCTVNADACSCTSLREGFCCLPLGQSCLAVLQHTAGSSFIALTLRWVPFPCKTLMR